MPLPTEESIMRKGLIVNEIFKEKSNSVFSLWDYDKKKAFKTPLCNRPSGIYMLTGFSKKTSLGRQIFHQVSPFCQVAILPFSTHKLPIWEYKSRTGEVTNWPGKI